jgi:hypothetical protein
MKKMIIGVAMALSSFSVLSEEVNKGFTVQHFNPATGLVTPYGYAPYGMVNRNNTGFNNFGNGYTNGNGYGDGAVSGGFNFGMSGRAQGRGYGQGNGNWSHSHVSNGVHRH